MAEPDLCGAFWMLGVLCCYYYSPCPLCNANTAADLSAILQGPVSRPQFSMRIIPTDLYGLWWIRLLETEMATQLTSDRRLA